MSISSVTSVANAGLPQTSASTTASSTTPAGQAGQVHHHHKGGTQPSTSGQPTASAEANAPTSDSLVDRTA